MVIKDAPESPESDETPALNTDTPEVESDAVEADTGDTFPRSYVEELRKENGTHRARAKEVEALAARAHAALVTATGKLVDPAVLPYDADHLDSPEKLNAAIDSLLADKPYLAARKVVGDAGQGTRGKPEQPADFSQFFK